VDQMGMSFSTNFTSSTWVTVETIQGSFFSSVATAYSSRIAALSRHLAVHMHKEC
jgi:hypothetical protein